MINGGQPTSRVSNFFGLPRSHMIADDTSLLRMHRKAKARRDPGTCVLDEHERADFPFF